MALWLQGILLLATTHPAGITCARPSKSKPEALNLNRPNGSCFGGGGGGSYSKDSTSRDSVLEPYIRTE